ncbi:juvenile hormone epoxide hydrolase [Amyelois transitella]|uniref:juvenile hormone epoxide hydrolase n=1 Tax=Amyelois transitella TaxID=680683 RepID=UPI00298F751D|nr:juvenile hormone epoxide hydrolase [Amyelois transitella]
MHRLGHKKYYIASNDMGMFIANFIVTAFPEDVLGYFTQLLILQNSLLSSVTDSAYTDSVYTANYTGRRTRDDDNRQSPYLFHQASSPDTLGIGLNDSPSGLLGYILEKFHFARVLDRKENAGVKIQDHIPRDVLLDNIMLYWMTGSITTSMRFYAETFNDRVIAMNVDETPSPVLTWITEPRYEISPHPHWVKKTKFPNLVSHKILNFGGHFLYYEFPDVYANEVISAVAAFRKIHISKNGL